MLKRACAKNRSVLADTLHAGRSRNDQVAADLRLYVKDRTREVHGLGLDAATSAWWDWRAARTGCVMPGYTHLQQAQPVLIAQPLLAYVAMLGRDWERTGLPEADRSLAVGKRRAGRSRLRSRS